MFSTGDIIRLAQSNSTTTSKCSFSLLVEKRGGKDNVYSFSRPAQPYHRLVASPKGVLSFEEGQSAGCYFTASDDKGKPYVIIKSCSIKCGRNGNPFILGIDVDGNLRLYNSDEATANENHLNVIVTKGGLSETTGEKGDQDMKTSGTTSSNNKKKKYSPSLELWQLQRFALEGYLHIPNAVDGKTMDACLRKLNRLLGTPGAVGPGGAQGNGLGKLGGSASNCKEVQALLDCVGVRRCLDSILGVDQWDDSNPSAQIAFRFPEQALGEFEGGFTNDVMEFTDKTQKNERDEDRFAKLNNKLCKSWHTDDLRRGEQHGFSLLVGICLSDVDAPFQGNLVLWPTSHLLIHASATGRFGAIDNDRLEYLYQRQTRLITQMQEGKCDEYIVEHEVQCNDSMKEEEDDDEGKTILNTSKSLDNTNTEKHNKTTSNININISNNNDNINSNSNSKSKKKEDIEHDNEPSLPSLGPPLHLITKARDLVVLHPNLAHMGGPNFGTDIRRMVYFRIKTKVRVRDNGKVNINGKEVGDDKDDDKDDREDVTSLEKGVEAEEERVGMGGGMGGGVKSRWTSWEAVSEAHKKDLWCDLPGAKVGISFSRTFLQTE